MLRFGKASAYAVFATVHIARNQSDGPVQGRLISEAYDIPSEYLFKILLRLVNAGIITSAPGRRGGYQLGKKPAEITLLEIVEAIEGTIDYMADDRDSFTTGKAGASCLVSLFGQAIELMRGLLRKKTLHDMLVAVENDERLAASAADPAGTQRAAGDGTGGMR
jgi:Rrf2 family protein